MIANGADVTIRAEPDVLAQRNLSHLSRYNLQRNRCSMTMRQSKHKHVTAFSTCGTTPLHRAAEHGQEAVARCLLDNGGDMLAIDAGGYYPVQLAAHQGHESIVRLFLERGFQPNTLSWAAFDPSALHSAVSGGQSGIVKLLLDHGANASLTKDSKATAYFNRSPLDLAFFDRLPNQMQQNLDSTLGKENIHSGKEDCALLLVEYGIPFELLEENRCLLSAARRGYTKLVKALVDLGLDPNQEHYGQTALSCARGARCQELIEFLKPLTNPNAKKKRKRRAAKS